MMLPVLAAMSVSLGVHPFLLMIPATLSTSFAFMMPVATPPNAIVFGSNYVRIADMARIGLVLNLIGIVLITTLMYLVIIPVLGL
jgi:sodium-dependent dicarboxylate transporter 2/3/5